MARRRSGKRTKKKSVNPLIVVGVVCAILLLTLVAGLVIGKSMIQSWLRGDEFRQWLAKKSSETLKSQVELAPLNWQGADVYSETFVANGYEDAAFSEMKVEGLRAKIGKIENRVFRVPEIGINRFEMEFSDDRIPGPREDGGGASSADSDETLQASSGPSVPGWLQKYVPNRVEVDEIVISSASIVTKGADGSVPFRLSGTETIVRPDFETSMWGIDGKGGKMYIPDQPEIRMKNLGLRWRGTQLFIDRCALGMYEDGHVDGAGEINFAEGEGFDLDLEFSGIQVDEVVDETWGERLSGVISGPVTLTGEPGAFVYEGDISVADAVIEKIPVLTVISKYTKNERFKYLVMSEATTHFRSEGGRVELTDIVLQSDGLVRIEGDMIIQDDRIAGIFQVGVTAGTLRWIPGAERKVFVEDRDGFLWTPMKLTGTLDEPNEDLSGRLIAAAGVAILEELPEGLLDEAQRFLNPGGDPDGTDPNEPNSILDQGKPLLDLLTPFLR